MDNKATGLSQIWTPFDVYYCFNVKPKKKKKKKNKKQLRRIVQSYIIY